MELLFGSLLLREIQHLNFYNKVKEFVSRKKYKDNLPKDRPHKLITELGARYF